MLFFLISVQARSSWIKSLHIQAQNPNTVTLCVKPKIITRCSPMNGALWNGNLPACGYTPNFEQKRYIRQEISKALVLVKDLKHLASSPGPALTIGLSGLVPFVAIPGYMIMSGTFLTGLAFSQIAYGACILSFVGAVRWGTALADQEVVTANWFNLGYSVAPALVAWTALMLPNSLALIVLMGGLAGTAYVDLTMFGYPPWFKALRFLLSLVAVLSLWTTLLCSFTMSDKKKKKAAKKEAEKKVLQPPVVPQAVESGDAEKPVEAAEKA